MLKVHDSLYDYNVAILKKYDDKHYKLTLHKTLKKKGLEVPRKHNTKCSINTEKLECNISRAKSKIYEYAMCNDFDYFVTLTLDPKKWDRYNFTDYYKKLGKFFTNYSRLHNTRIQYVLIPERHSDGAWHMHGLIKGILKEHLIRNKNNYLEWGHYTSRFGYMSLGKVKSKEAVSKYITKYISKDMNNTIKELGAKTYYCSRGLKKAVEIKRGTLAKELQFDFENDYIKTTNLTDIDISKGIF